MQDLSQLSTEELLRLRQQAAQQPAAQPVAPIDPRIAPQVQRDQAQATVAVRTTDADVQKAIADARRADAEARRAEMELQRGPQQTATEIEIANKEQGLAKRANVIRQQMKVVRDLYEKSIKGQPATRLFGLTEKIDGLPANEEFRIAAENILPLIRPLVAQTAREGDSDREMQIFMSFIPTNGDSDRTIEQKLASLERLVNGMVDGKSATDVAQSGALAQDDADAAGVGATEGRVPLSDEFKGNLEQLKRGIYQGTVTPEQYAAERMRMDRAEFGDQAKDQRFTYMEEAYQMQSLFGQGARPEDVPAIDSATRELSQADQFRNNVAASPLGTAAINYFDATGLGGVSALAGEQMRAVNELNPFPATIGQIGGAITGTGLAGSLGRRTLAQQFPALFGGGAKGQFARNVGTDIAYGTAYGTNTGMDAGDAALSSTVGSVGGNIAGKLVGKTLGGVNVDPAVDYLRNRNIPLTTGQTLGGVAKSIEDRMAGLPFIGDMVGQRRLEGLQAFNREAFNEAGKPIGFTSQRIGSEGLADLQGATGQAYDNAVAGRTFQIDDQFNAEYDVALEAAKNLPPDLRDNALLAFRNRVDPLSQQETLYRGVGGDSGGGNYYTPDMEFARNFTRSGRDSEIISKSVPRSAIYEPKALPRATSEAELTAAIAEAKQRGFNAVRVSEGDPNTSVFIIDPQAPLAGNISGPQYQGIRSDLKGYRSEQTGPGFPADYRDVMTQGITALDNLVARQGGEEVVQGLERANTSYRLGKVVQDATERAKGGSQSGEVRTFTPSQLQMANQASGRRFPGANPLAELADQGQRVLPSTIPDSGTAGRLATLALPGAVAGGGAGLGFAAGGADGAQTGATTSGALATALMLLGTKQGQRALNAALTQRGDKLPKAVEAFNRNQAVRAMGGGSGIFGRIALLPSLESSR